MICIDDKNFQNLLMNNRYIKFAVRDKVPTLEPDQTSRSTGSNQTNICPTNTHRQNAEQDLIGVSRRIAGRLHHRGWAQEEEQGKQG